MKNLSKFFVVLLTVAMVMQATSSEAAVGKIIGNKRVVVVGLAMTGSGVAIAAGGAAIVNATCQDLGCLAVLFPLMGGAIVGAAGLITLDGEQEIAFTALDKASAAKLQISEAERTSFNEELDQANIILADVATEMSKMAKPTAQDSVNAWNQVKDLVSPLTFTAMQKIAAQK
jgi:hypothetical protein